MGESNSQTVPNTKNSGQTARVSNAAAACALKQTTKRTMNRRGVMWLGQTCNQRCYFCYFIERVSDRNHPEHAFMTIDKAKRICHILRYTFGNTAIDIQGGEPTIHKDILELCRYCHEIGLYPTLITNGLVLGKAGELEKYRDAGVRDFLVSLHGIGPIHDEVVCVNGAYDRITKALERMRELDFPFRINCTMSKPVIPILTEVAAKAIEYGALAVNFIAFNPFGDQQSGHRRADTVATYSEVRVELTKAIDLLEAAGIEVNVRYLPLCMAEARHRKNFYNFQQLTYDHHEWDYQSWSWTMMHTQMMKEGGLVPPFLLGPYGRRLRCGDNCFHIRDRAQEHPIKQGFKFWVQRSLSRVLQTVRGKDAVWREEARIRATNDCGYVYHEACGQCAAQAICDGFHGDYAQFFGTGEAQPVTGLSRLENPAVFIREQKKWVEPEDEGWAL